MGGTSWLIRDGSDRARMLDMEERLRKTRPQSLAVMIGALLLLGPWYGWWLAGVVLAAAAIFGVADLRVRRLRRPELALFGAWLGVDVAIALAYVVAGAPAPLAAWFVFPITTVVSRFSARGVALGVIVTLVALAAASFGVHGSAVLANPPLLLAPAGVIVVVGFYSLSLIRSDADHRSDALVDELTEMLNRKALVRHVEELEQQSAVRGMQAAIVIADIDRFKQINDRHGHDAGDVALREVAELIRGELRAYDHAFRLGGEEFLLLLPGADREQALLLAERVREGVAREPLSNGLEVTVSCGVATSAPASHFDYTTLFAEADAALYDAKASGRNCVRERARPDGAQRALAASTAY